MKNRKWKLEEEKYVYVGDEEQLLRVMKTCNSQAIHLFGVIDMPGHGDKYDEMYRLIEVGPNMLDVLREAVREVEGFEKRTGIPQFATWVAKTKEIIAYVEGEKP